MRYNLIMFDADGTLFDFEQAERTAFFGAFARYGVDVSERWLKIYSKLNAGFWKMLERGEIEKKEMLWQRFDELCRQMGVDIDPKELNSSYLQCLGDSSVLFDGAARLIEQLSHDYEMVIITNGNECTQRKRIANSGIEQYFSHSFISDAIGAQKPDKLFFDRVFETLGRSDRENMLVVGDSLTSDIKGANNAGIDACWYNPKHKRCGQEYSIRYNVHSYRQLLKILKK